MKLEIADISRNKDTVDITFKVRRTKVFEDVKRHLLKLYDGTVSCGHISEDNKYYYVVLRIDNEWNPFPDTKPKKDGVYLVKIQTVRDCYIYKIVNFAKDMSIVSKKWKGCSGFVDWIDGEWWIVGGIKYWKEI